MIWESELKSAHYAALTAGQYLASNKLNTKQAVDLSGRDVKLSADRESEDVILEILTRFTPYPVLSEESGLTGKMSQDDRIWIVDPLDGTLNYSRDINICSVSIALYQGLEPLLGVVYDFNRNELFSGVVGFGAECNGCAIKVSTVSNPSQAVLATGFPVNRDFESAALQTFIEYILQFKKVRLIGSAALSLAYVACGRIDAYIEEDIMLWDIAAGLALARSAGAWTKLQPTNRRPWAMTAQASSHRDLFGIVCNS